MVLQLHSTSQLHKATGEARRLCRGPGLASSRLSCLHSRAAIKNMLSVTGLCTQAFIASNTQRHDFTWQPFLDYVGIY